MAGITVSENLIMEAKKLFETKAKRGESGGKVKFTLSQKDTMGFYAAQGVTQEIQERIAEVEAALHTGAIAFIDDQFPGIVEQAKANNIPVEDLRVFARMTTPSSRTRIAVDAVSSRPAVGDKDTVKTVYGRCSIKVSTGKYIPTDFMKDHFTKMETLLKD